MLEDGSTKYSHLGEDNTVVLNGCGGRSWSRGRETAVDPSTPKVNRRPCVSGLLLNLKAPRRRERQQPSRPRRRELGRRTTQRCHRFGSLDARSALIPRRRCGPDHGRITVLPSCRRPRLIKTRRPHHLPTPTWRAHPKPTSAIMRRKGLPTLMVKAAGGGR